MNLYIHLQPRASRNEIVSKDENLWKVRVTAPATNNEANEALIKLLSKELKIAKSLITIVSGATSKNKTVVIYE